MSTEEANDQLSTQFSSVGVPVKLLCSTTSMYP